MWLPIVHYNRTERPTTLLRQGNRAVLGKLSDYGRWGEILSGDFLTLHAFAPTEFAFVPDDLIPIYDQG